MVDLSSYLPEFIIVGAAKSGTSSLYRYLEEHPNIYMPRLKELNFFHTYGIKESPIILRSIEMPTNIMSYTGHFYEAEEMQIKGEASPSYLIYYNRTIANIKKFYSNRKEPKIIIILREPIDKIWSHFKYNRMHGLDPDFLSLDEAIEAEPQRIKKQHYLPDVHYLNNTMYFEQVKAYIDNFKDVLVVLFDDLQSNPNDLISRIHDFLGVERIIPDNLGAKYNQSLTKKIPKNQIIKCLMELKFTSIPFPFKQKFKNYLLRNETMPSNVNNQLKIIFTVEVEKLEKLLNIDLSMWLSKYK